MSLKIKYGVGCWLVSTNSVVGGDYVAWWDVDQQVEVIGKVIEGVGVQYLTVMRMDTKHVITLNIYQTVVYRAGKHVNIDVKCECGVDFVNLLLLPSSNGLGRYPFTVEM